MAECAFDICGRQIGPGQAPYIIAEISANHGGSLELALKTLEAAAMAGADAVKLQTYTPDTMTLDYDGPGFVINGGLWNGRTLYGLYEEAHTPWAWHEALFACGRKLGITVFSTPFDPSSVEFLESLGCPAYKVASFEAVDLPLIECVAKTGKPIIISTGMCELDEITEAVTAARRNGCKDLALLHCVSAYPAPVEECNLRTLHELSTRFDAVVGLSDHTLGLVAPVTAIALGAALVEKHFTLNRQAGGPDSSFSIEPTELALLVESCGQAWRAMGSVRFGVTDAERSSLAFRRSLYAVRDIPVGGIVDPSNVRAIRPGFGLAPKFLRQIMGRRTARGLRRGTPLSWDALK